MEKPKSHSENMVPNQELNTNPEKNKEFWKMEFTPSPSSIFQNKKIKYNNKKPTKNEIIWINFSKIRKARCTLTPLSLRSARLTQYMRFARCTSLSHILLRYATQNIAYTETLYEICFSFYG